MTIQNNIKLLKAGFTILRRSEYPEVCIKKCVYRGGSIVWVYYQRCFDSKAARDRMMKHLLRDDDKIIED